LRRGSALAVALAAGSFAGAFVLRGRVGGRRTRVDLYLADGDMRALAAGSPAADRMLALAADALAAARGTPA
jgi:hypothetical protein